MIFSPLIPAPPAPAQPWLWEAIAFIAGAIALGALVHAMRLRVEARFWQKRSDYWFKVAQDRGLPEFHHHPLYHATRRYASLDAFLDTAAARVQEGD